MAAVLQWHTLAFERYDAVGRIANQPFRVCGILSDASPARRMKLHDECRTVPRHRFGGAAQSMELETFDVDLDDAWSNAMQPAICIDGGDRHRDGFRSVFDSEVRRVQRVLAG